MHYTKFSNFFYVAVYKYSTVHFNPTYAEKIKQGYLDMMDFNLTRISQIKE